MGIKNKRLVIIDGNSLLHRAHHALPPLTNKKGELVSAIYGFLLIFLKAARELQPNYLVATFDLPAPTFRHKKFKDYKAKRPKAPEEFYSQIPKVKEILKNFNVPIFEKESYEADDIIGTIALQAPKRQVFPGIETIVLSGDLDVLQLVNSRTKAYIPKKGIKDVLLYDEKTVQERYQGLSSRQLPDYKALKGDPSDNIPGVPGIGDKTAIELLREFNNLETLYRELEKQTQRAKKLKPKLREILVKNKEQAFFSKMLSTIKTDVPLEFNLEECQWGKYDKGKTTQLLKDLEFYSLINRLP